jgi:hypothetical protein
VLLPSPEVVERREAERSKKGYDPWTIADLDDALRSRTPRIGLWLDTSEQTPDATIDELLLRVEEARVGS